jgi:hypothetical protein
MQLYTQKFSVAEWAQQSTSTDDCEQQKNGECFHSAIPLSCAALRVPTAQNWKTTTSLTVFTFLCAVFP